MDRQRRASAPPICHCACRRSWRERLHREKLPSIISLNQPCAFSTRFMIFSSSSIPRKLPKRLTFMLKYSVGREGHRKISSEVGVGCSERSSREYGWCEAAGATTAGLAFPRSYLRLVLAGQCPCLLNLTRSPTLTSSLSFWSPVTNSGVS